MGHQKWSDENLSHLIHDTIGELRKRFPNYTKGGLKAAKARYNKKIKEGQMPMPPNPEKDSREEVVHGQLYKTWEVSAFNRETNEWETTINRGFDYRANADEQTFDQAQPARVTPSRRKAPNRDHRRLFVFSDAQISYRRLEDNTLEPVHDERAMRVARLICRDVQPDEIINLGDTVDLAEFSSFKPDSDHYHRTLGPSFQRVHDMYAEYRADNPHAKITEVDSNHNTRLKKFMLSDGHPLYGFRRPGEPEEEYPQNTYPFMANLLPLEVNWISGYGAAEYVYGEGHCVPPIIFKHGTTVASSGSTALKESKENPETHIVRGHGHRMESHTRTNRAGQYLASIMVGALCRIDGAVPSYGSAVDDRNNIVRRQENWQQSLLVIYDYGGRYQFDNIPIEDGKAFYNGKEYDGEV